MKKVRFKKYVQCSNECKDFLFSLLNKEPKNRLGYIGDSLEVMNHPWFRGFNWTELMNKKLEPPYKPN